MHSGSRALGFVVVAASLAGCAVERAPTAPHRLTPTVGLRLSLALARSAETRSLRVVARYARASSPQVLRALDSATATLSLGASAVPVRLNIGECLRDPNRESPTDSTTGQPRCVLHLTVTLLDESSRVVDEASLAPLGAKAGEEVNAPEIVLGPRPVAPGALVAGTSFSCALDERGSLYCWGVNAAGQFGNGDTVSSSTPRLAAGGKRFTQISGAGANVCGIALGGSVYCWGGGLVSQPAGPTGPVRSPVAIDSSLHFREVSVGVSYACGIVETDDAYCWGNNRSGNLGVGDTVARTRPTRVTGGIKFRSVSAGLFATCGTSTTTPSQIYCWGSNAVRMISSDSTIAVVPTPTAVALPGGARPMAVASGASVVCALSESGALFCWGSDSFGSLAKGTVGGRLPTPTPAATNVTFTNLAVGKENNIFTAACGWTSAGTGYCWGSNSSGQLGSSEAASQCSFRLPTETIAFSCSAVPIPVAGGTSFTSMASGGQHTCGITPQHAIMCWGANDAGQLGDGTRNDAASPIPVQWNVRAP